MLLAQKGNRVCQINDNDIQKYFDDGFTIMNLDGTVLKEAVPNDIPTLKAKLSSALHEVDVLKENIKVLQDKINELNLKLVTSEQDKLDANPKRRTRKNDNVE